MRVSGHLSARRFGVAVVAVLAVLVGVIAAPAAADPSPESPYGLQVVILQTEVTLSWKGSVDVADGGSYRVERFDGSAWDELEHVGTTEEIQGDLENKTFRIERPSNTVAYDERWRVTPIEGTTEGTAAEIRFTMSSRYPATFVEDEPAAPFNVQSFNTTTRNYLSWSTAEGDVETVAYRVELYDEAEEEWIAYEPSYEGIGETGLLMQYSSFWAPRVPMDNLYESVYRRWRITSIGADSSESDPVEVIVEVPPPTTGPGPVTDLGTSVAATEVFLTWSTTGRPSPALDYEVQQNVEGTGWEDAPGLLQMPYSTFRAERPMVLQPTDVQYRIRGINSEGEPGSWALAEVEVPPYTSVPVAVTDLQASLGTDTITLTWSHSPWPTPAATYDVERRIDGGSWSAAPGTPDFEDESFVATRPSSIETQDVDFRVRAVNAEEESSDWSEVSIEVEPDQTYPVAPQYLGLWDIDEVFSVSWDDPPNVPPVDGYEIDASSDGSTWSLVSPATYEANVEVDDELIAVPEEPPFVQLDPVPGDPRHQIRLRALAGELSSPPSEPWQVRAVRSAPTDVQITKVGSSLHLEWSSAGAIEGDTYQIWELIDDEWVNVRSDGELDEPGQTFDIADSPRSADETRSFRVHAVRFYDDETVISGPSEPASIELQALPPMPEDLAWTRDGDDLTLGWDLAEGGLAVEGYRVEVRARTEDEWSEADPGDYVLDVEARTLLVEGGADDGSVSPFSMVDPSHEDDRKSVRLVALGDDAESAPAVIDGYLVVGVPTNLRDLDGQNPVDLRWDYTTIYHDYVIEAFWGGQWLVINNGWSGPPEADQGTLQVFERIFQIDPGPTEVDYTVPLRVRVARHVEGVQLFGEPSEPLEVEVLRRSAAPTDLEVLWVDGDDPGGPTEDTVVVGWNYPDGEPQPDDFQVLASGNEETLSPIFVLPAPGNENELPGTELIDKDHEYSQPLARPSGGAPIATLLAVAAFAPPPGGGPERIGLLSNVEELLVRGEQDPTVDGGVGRFQTLGDQGGRIVATADDRHETLEDDQGIPVLDGWDHDGLQTFFDGQLGFIPGPNGMARIYGPNGTGTARVVGTRETPLADVEEEQILLDHAYVQRETAPPVVEPPTPSIGGLLYTYDEDEILMTYHYEHYGTPGAAPDDVLLGMAYSDDGGLTFEVLGDDDSGAIITGEDVPSHNMGAGPIVPVGEDLYVYFGENEWGGRVARASIEDVIEAARQDEVPEFTKYWDPDPEDEVDGGFTEPGIGGRSTPVMTDAVPLDIAYNTCTEEFYAVSLDFGGLASNVVTVTQISTSPDGIHWGPQDVVQVHRGGTRLYPSFAPRDTGAGKTIEGDNFDIFEISSPIEAQRWQLSEITRLSLVDTDAAAVPGCAAADEDDRPSVSIDPIANVLERGDGADSTASFEVSLSEPVDDDVTVEYFTTSGSAVSGEDFVGEGTRASKASVVIPEGETSATIDIEVTDDDEEEGIEPETFRVRITTPTDGIRLAHAVGKVLINDVDTIETAIGSLDPFGGGFASHQVIEGDAAVAEDPPGPNVRTVRVPVAISRAFEDDLTVLVNTEDGTATTANGDYVALVDQVVTIEEGDTVAWVEVQIGNDADETGDRSFALTVELGPGEDPFALLGTSTTITVLDDDI